MLGDDVLLPEAFKALCCVFFSKAHDVSLALTVCLLWECSMSR